MLTHKASIGWRGIRAKKSGKWESRWADETGKVCSKSWADKAVARAYADDMANAVMRGAVGLGTNKPIADALALFLERRLDHKTTALNQRRMLEFLRAMPEVKHTRDITDSVINRYDAVLEATGHNPGGRNHNLKIVRAFSNYCREKNWLAVNPFAKFKMPKSTYQGRKVPQEHFERLCSIGWVGSNERADIHGLGWQGGNQYKDIDLWLRRAFIFGRETMLRISQVWKLTPKDFREPGEVWVEGIKGQPGEFKALTPAALAVLRELLPGRAPDARFFGYWNTVASMESAVYKKCKRVGVPTYRYHDICKVTRVTQLDDAGFSTKKIAQLSNTSERTLLAHYIKHDKKDTEAEYRKFSNLEAEKGYGTKFPEPEKLGLPPEEREAQNE